VIKQASVREGNAKIKQKSLQFLAVPVEFFDVFREVENTRSAFHAMQNLNWGKERIGVFKGREL